ncbi:MAG: M14 family metallopeptidase [Acidobacteriota bacterium]
MTRPGDIALWILMAVAVVLCGFQPAAAEAWGPRQVGPVAAEPGTKVSGRLDVPALGDETGTYIPITLIHGAKPGKTLGLIAGVHGSEYAPILAMQRLPGLIDPGALSGTVVVVHAANVPAFFGRTIYVGPVDGKNLNRSFPGSADGTLSERIAHTLTETVIRGSDLVMDIHAGDGNEGLRPSYTGYYAEAGSPEVIATSRDMAVAFGLDTIVAFKGDLTRESAIWCGSAAVALGIPSIDIESGERGRTGDEYVDPIVDGVLSVLRHFDMLPGEPTPSIKPFIVTDRARLKSEHSGLWTPDPRIRPGDYVTEGARLGAVTDWSGEVLQEVRATAGGALLILMESPPVNKGETVAVIAKVGQP